VVTLVVHLQPITLDVDDSGLDWSNNSVDYWLLMERSKKQLIELIVMTDPEDYHKLIDVESVEL